MRYTIHDIENAQLTAGYPPAMAVIIGTRAHRPIVEALKSLHAHQCDTPVLYTECNVDAAPALIDECIRKNTVAVSIGDVPYTPADRPFSAAIITPSSDAGQEELYRPVWTHPQLDSLSVIGFQTYLSSPDSLTWLYDRFYETLRLGAFRDNPALAEPLLRESTHVFFNLRAVRAADAPDTERPAPNGLYAEEICQLAAFAGRVPKLASFHLAGFVPCLDPQSLTAQTAAHVLWHLLEGVAVRIRLDMSDKSEEHLERMIVEMDDNGQALEFLHDTITDHWWLQIPLTDGRCRYIACLHEDYLRACRREAPVRWLLYFQKFNKGV
ncbi:MAG: hypothetical protein LBF19_00995 [Prevotellaceae bacterium]|jgi:hypothetical protein|nr:hypothetical protein [Prevotellaceae bacterium]